MRASIESQWLRRDLHRWRGAIGISNQTLFGS